MFLYLRDCKLISVGHCYKAVGAVVNVCLCVCVCEIMCECTNRHHTLETSRVGISTSRSLPFGLRTQTSSTFFHHHKTVNNRVCFFLPSFVFLVCFAWLTALYTGSDNLFHWLLAGLFGFSSSLFFCTATNIPTDTHPCVQKAGSICASGMLTGPPAVIVRFYHPQQRCSNRIGLSTRAWGGRAAYQRHVPDWRRYNAAD